MSLRSTLNSSLRKATGFEIRRASAAGAAPAKPEAAKKAPRPKSVEIRETADPELDRLLRKPVFIMSPVRSGSTLLRMLVGGHSKLHAPHELHIRRLAVQYSTSFVKKSMDELGLDLVDLEHLLWDRVMHREVVKHDAEFIVEKTPSNAFVYKRIAAIWPDARYIFLLRHPLSIARSWHESDPEKRSMETAVTDALRYMKAVERAREALPGHTVRYEEITADPEHALKDICSFLDLEFEPGMVDYGQQSKADMKRGLGDWREKILSGSVQPGRELPTEDEIPEALRPMCEAWGYLKGSEDNGAA
ncbi:sulfotransferase family protein [Streptomyces sp. TR06-5]|uniref:sulfotransferase family protein n=1 Tax=unclassified Streptomyces TaxID=2593676 RepID=UPI0039A284C8